MRQRRPTHLRTVSHAEAPFPAGAGPGSAASFEDIRSLSLQCRFRDCTHADEPDCAVRAGVAPDRLANYQKMLRDLRRDTMTPLQKREVVSMWKARGRAAAVRMKMKRG